MNRPKSLSSRWSIAAAAVGLIVVALVMFGPLSGQDARVLITEPIDESKLVTLVSNTRPEARNPQNDRGPVPDSFVMVYMELLLRRPAYLQQQFDQLLVEQTTKGSPNYQRWITQEQLGETYGLAQQDIDTLTGWLRSKGFTIDQVLTNRTIIGFTGTAAQVRDAFHTEIHYLEVGGEQHHANMSDPQMPAALAPAVVGVVSMHDFKPHALARPGPNYSYSGCAVGTGPSNGATTRPTNPAGGNCYYLVPGDFQTIYNVTPLLRQGITGTGQVIAVVEDSDTYSTDTNTYRTTFLNQYALGTVTTVHPGSGCSDPGTNANDSEADIDVDMASVAAPGATMLVAACADGSTSGVLIALQNYSSYSPKPTIFSVSYLECEAKNTAATNAAFNTAYSSVVGSGVSVFVATDDAGASGCSAAPSATYGIGINGFASTQYNVAMGGTDFEDTYQTAFATGTSAPNNATIPISTYWNSTNTSLYGSAKGYIPEIPWNDTCASWLITNYLTQTIPEFCNTSTDDGDVPKNTGTPGQWGYLNETAGGGGPSACATGTASTTGVVSGSCAGYAKPSWQLGISGNPSDNVRDVPDVSLFASNGPWGHKTIICYSDTGNGGFACTAGSESTWASYGGTSIAAPLMAGIQALINQKWKSPGVGYGNPNPTLYAIASAQFSASNASNCYSINQLAQSRHGIGTNCAFYDITQGDLSVDCQGSSGYSCNYTSTYGALSTQPVSTISVTAAGSGYTSTPTCTLGAPTTSTPYYSPTGTQITPAGVHATCAASTGTPATGSVTMKTDPAGWPGHLSGSGTNCSVSSYPTVTIAGTTYTMESNDCGLSGGSTVAVLTYDSSSGSTDEEATAQNLAAAVMDNSNMCSSRTGAPCFQGITSPNSLVTAAYAGGSSKVTSLTATSTGTGSDFTVSTSYSTGMTVVSGTNGASGTTVTSIALSNVGQGYAPGPVACTISGGGGTLATCSAAVTATTTSTSTLQPAFYATPGWDFATGIGSINAYNLVFNSAW